MRLLSAYDDLMQRTLAGLLGPLNRVRFLARLRSAAGQDYEHWGLERTYGKEPAQSAMRQAHTEAFVRELSTPVSELWQELVSAAKSEGLEAAECAQSLLGLIDSTPQELGGGSVEHHQYVVTSLTCLARSPRLAIRQAA